MTIMAMITTMEIGGDNHNNDNNDDDDSREAEDEEACKGDDIVKERESIEDDKRTEYNNDSIPLKPPAPFYKEYSRLSARVTRARQI